MTDILWYCTWQHVTLARDVTKLHIRTHSSPLFLPGACRSWGCSAKCRLPCSIQSLVSCFHNAWEGSLVGLPYVFPSGVWQVWICHGDFGATPQHPFYWQQSFCNAWREVFVKNCIWEYRVSMSVWVCPQFGPKKLVSRVKNRIVRSSMHFARQAASQWTYKGL